MVRTPSTRNGCLPFVLGRCNWATKCLVETRLSHIHAALLSCSRIVALSETTKRRSKPRSGEKSGHFVGEMFQTLSNPNRECDA